jgi:hypothetical protein
MLHPEKALVILDTAGVVGLVLEEHVSVTGHASVTNYRLSQVPINQSMMG